MTKKTILLIDDEKDILKLLQYNLEKEGFGVITAVSGESGFELAKAKRPDLVVLDIMMPGMDGLEVLKLLKKTSQTQHVPVVMLTAKGTETDQVVGLELGAADYISKPFSVKVFLARVRNIFRSSESRKTGGVLTAGEVILDKDRWTVTVKGDPVNLTKLEFRILSFLMENPGKVFTRDQLLSGAWEGEAFVVDRTVDVHIRSIRKKLAKCRRYLETVRGAGYRFMEI